MYSDLKRSTVVALCALAALVTLGVSTGCGRKEDPEPPPRKNPGRTNDLKVRQRGTDLFLTMSYPALTMGGLALPGIDGVEVERFVRPAPEFMEQPELEGEEADPTEEGGPEEGVEEEGDQDAPSEDPTEESAPEGDPTGDEAGGEPEEQEAESDESEADEDETTEDEGEEETEGGEETSEDEGAMEMPEPNPFLQIRVDPDEFRKNAETILVLEGEDLEAAVVGGQIVIRLPLEEVATEPPEAYTFRVETFAGGLRSPESNFASFVPLPPPPPPADLTATPERTGVRLSWSEYTGEDEIEGYNVYRRLPVADLYPEPLSFVPPELSEYVDRSAQFGSRYDYAVTTVRMQRPLVESAVGEDLRINFTDDFAPLTPANLVALAEAGRIRLVWDASQEGDVVGYLVFVSRDGGEAEQLTAEPVRAAEYVHEGTVTGSTYVYHVVAVDSAGNRSEASEEVETRAP